MSKKLIKMLSLVTLAAVMASTVGCAQQGSVKAEETNIEVNESETQEVKEDAVTAASEQVELIDLEWDAIPELGIVKGDLYKIEERFRQGHLGTLEVVTNGDKITKVKFNELGRPNYYIRQYQNVPKRYSEYNFAMGEAKGAAWIQSVVAVEKQMVEQQRLSGEFDVVSGASNSVFQSMVPLAEKIEANLGTPSNQKYYSIAEDLGGGLTGVLEIVLEDGKIISCKYDEIFATNPDDIEDVKLKKHYRTSKYESITYQEPSRIGFNVQMDALNEKVVETQNLLDLTDLPAIEATGDYGKTGYTERNTAWDNYLKLAEKLLAEMKADQVL